MANSKINGPNCFWSMVWGWSLEDVEMFMKQRDKILNASSKRRRHRISKPRAEQ